MKILIGVAHPKHVFIFKNVINSLINRGHEIKVIAIEKEMTTYLLKKFGIPFDIIGTNQPTLMKKLLELPKWEYNTFKIAKEFKPDIYVGRALPHFAHISAILKKPFIIFEDTEIAKLVHTITLPFATAVVTPHCYQNDHGIKHIRFNGYFELGYLHPNYFKPDPSVLDELGLDKDEKFVIVRFVAWNASHDIGDKGFSDKKELIMSLEEKCKVFISSETKLPEELEKFRISVSPEKMHHLMYYANLFIGESATMAAECAILGTPGIFVSTSRRGYTDELEQRYDMVYNFCDPINNQENALNIAMELLNDKNTKNKWQEKRIKLLKDKINVTEFITEFIEGYPDSYKNYKY